jgi:hypothetical protein
LTYVSLMMQRAPPHESCEAGIRGLGEILGTDTATESIKAATESISKAATDRVISLPDVQERSGEFMMGQQLKRRGSISSRADDAPAEDDDTPAEVPREVVGHAPSPCVGAARHYWDRHVVVDEGVSALVAKSKTSDVGNTCCTVEPPHAPHDVQNVLPQLVQVRAKDRKREERQVEGEQHAGIGVRVRPLLVGNGEDDEDVVKGATDSNALRFGLQWSLESKPAHVVGPRPHLNESPSTITCSINADQDVRSTGKKGKRGHKDAARSTGIAPSKKKAKRTFSALLKRK